MPLFTKPEQDEEFKALLEANRTRALWFLPRHYFPSDTSATQRILERIAARGDRASFVRARRLLSELL